MEIKLNTQIPYNFIGEKHIENMEQEVVLNIKFYKKYTQEEIYISFYYVYETKYLYYSVRDKGDTSFSKEDLCWYGTKKGTEDELFNDLFKGTNNCDIKYDLSDFEKEVVKEVERIIEEKDYLIIGEKQNGKKVIKYQLS